jgi:hypothetical protein
MVPVDPDTEAVMSAELARHLDTTADPAKWAYKRLARSVKEFEDSLDAHHEVGTQLVAFGPSVTLRINHLGYWSPDFIKIYADDWRGQTVQLVQHISQVNVMLVALPKTGPHARRIGERLLMGLEQPADQG